MALIARLYDPSEGTVAVDGADVREVDVGSLRSRDRLRRRRQLPVHRQRRREHRLRPRRRDAARRSKRRRGGPRPTSFIRDLPDGYETRVGERGLTLSGGQRQRVAIARALLADPRILILDDATSSVDATTEAAIKAGLREAMAGRTTFVIAHRLSTVSLADEIVVMDGGRIVDRGTHEELMRGLRLLPRDRRARPRRLGLPAARPRGARGDGAAVNERRARTRLRNVCLLFAALWRLVRGQDQRGRKVRWMIGLLRPYRGRVALMFVALLIETGAGARAALPRRPGDRRRHRHRRRQRPRPDRRRLRRRRRRSTRSPPTPQTYLVGWVGTRALQDLRERVFAHLQSMSIGFFTRRSPGVLISRHDQRRRGAQPAGHRAAW